MQTFHADASSLMGVGIEAAVGRCVVCAHPLGDESWWVTTYPNGEHTRCRDWSQHPFPFERQVRGLRKVWAQVPNITMRREVARVGKLLVEMERSWPAAGARSVMEALRETRLLRGALLGAGVPPKVVGLV